MGHFQPALLLKLDALRTGQMCQRFLEGIAGLFAPIEEAAALQHACFHIRPAVGTIHK
jgi:hypothetical protein